MRDAKPLYSLHRACFVVRRKVRSGKPFHNEFARGFCEEKLGSKQSTTKSNRTPQRKDAPAPTQMNTPSPLIPQGSLQEQKNRSRTRMRTAFIFIASIHIVGLVTLLTMQGCKQREQATETPVDNATAQTFNPTNNTTIETNTGLTTLSNTAPVETFVAQTNTIATMATTATEYTIVKGDSFATIGKAHGVSPKAIQDANPGVDPKKLQIGKKIVLPAPSAAPATTVTGTPAPAVAESYTVASGDTLTSIAKKFSITVNQLRKANNMTTDRIKVGEKLNIPAKAPGAMIAPATHTIAAAPAAPMTTTVASH